MSHGTHTHEIKHREAKEWSEKVTGDIHPFLSQAPQPQIWLIVSRRVKVRKRERFKSLWDFQVLKFAFSF